MALPAEDLYRPITDEESNKRKASPELSEAPVEKRIKTTNGQTVYGNPKETFQKPREVFDSNSVLDLSCKDRPKSHESTYQNFPNRNQPFYPDAYQPSNLEIKLVNSPKRPSPAEQLQIAKIQQQQRRSVQQQQKILQQMRRTLEGGRTKEEPPPPPAFPLQSMPYIDTSNGPTKELPESHPVLPLLDPVYFSALYNAHGFMPPSSPSIAAAFIGTLQEALPKLSMMFPPTTAASSVPPYLHHQKGGENPN